MHNALRLLAEVVRLSPLIAIVAVGIFQTYYGAAIRARRQHDRER